MIIIQDTREKATKKGHILNEFYNMGIKVYRSKLCVGDYVIANKQNASVDVKQNWLELAMCICGKQHTRFRFECLRAQDMGIRLVILVEENKPVQEWVSPKRRNGTKLTQVNGITLGKAMNTMQERYGVEFMYCDKKDTARKIIEILGGINETKNT